MEINSIIVPYSKGVPHEIKFTALAVVGMSLNDWLKTAGKQDFFPSLKKDESKHHAKLTEVWNLCLAAVKKEDPDYEVPADAIVDEPDESASGEQAKEEPAAEAAADGSAAPEETAPADKPKSSRTRDKEPPAPAKP